ncbi:RNA polymerase recycling motor ATPase HelR [Cellulomonas xiejunii]|uniref:AAA family ATPase n=1 Tax=Cellulomonas xiejunii TaxID=2968083 RepID=A0ABY5KR95_9CELL|nr:RNA polymerase recycling motor ATPase HelR [Cellulomonas xiejunii]MCC2322336.1 AAA family ATPase [Cellulomonas xiejunii]UUI72388.1 AAA family ATPase [Cellulomonas xiejunii]
MPGPRPALPTSAFALPTSAFALPAARAAKADPALVARDEQLFAALGATLDAQVADLRERVERLRRAPGGHGQAALDRDQDIHRLSGRLRLLERFGLDLCLGRMVLEDSPEPVYVGRLGLTTSTGERLLVDWRSPAAEPYFAATLAHPMGLVSRRRYRWTEGRVTDYWDEVFTPEGYDQAAALDDQSAFIASLGASRSAHMRDVLGTLQADQDAIIRAASRTPLVVDGGPGTGKTVVAVHRAAYLLHSDPRLRDRHGRVLLVGPHRQYLSYVADALPGLGEEGVLTCTVRDMVPEGATATPETDPRVARLKASVGMVRAIEPAVRFSERPPTQGMRLMTPWGEVSLSADDWADAFDAPDPGTPHNEARDQAWEALVEIITDGLPDDVPVDQLRRALTRDAELTSTFTRCWPIIEAADLVADLWSVPAYLRLCAPWLTPDEVRLLQRDDPRAWTEADLPLLDAARRRLGDPAESRRRRRRGAQVAAEREYMSHVVDNLVAGDDSTLGVMHMLGGEDMRSALVDEAGLPSADPDLLAGPFAHVVVDEAQELTDAQWQMLLTRCPSRSVTIVGDRAQARHGFPESWTERLERVGLRGVDVSSLRINYRTPVEVMTEAEPVIRAAVPDANVPTSVRSTGLPVVHGARADLASVVEDWLATHEGVACVIGDPTFPAGPRVRSLTPQTAKGLEFDLVVLVEPDQFGDGIEGAVDRYVAMTRTTQQLVVLTARR